VQPLSAEQIAASVPSPWVFISRFCQPSAPPPMEVSEFYRVTDGFLSAYELGGRAVLSDLASKRPSEGPSICPAGLVTWAALRGG
jgi:hypothetical protein